MRRHWTGAGTALVTPFAAGGDVDEAGVGPLARRPNDGDPRLAIFYNVASSFGLFPVNRSILVDDRKQETSIHTVFVAIRI